VDPEKFDFEDVFDEDYLYFYEPLLAPQSDADADLIWRLLELTPGQRVLDLACGYGRITERLAQKGAEAAGLDSSPLFIQRARRSAEDKRLHKIEYVEGDMRRLPWESDTFEATISWFTSFGYYGDADNRTVLTEARRTLKPGGKLLIELNNLPALLPHWLPNVTFERGDDFILDHPRFDPVSGRAVTERIVVRGGNRRRFYFSVRMFVPAELKDWLLDAGFETVAFYDNQGEPLTLESRRAIAVATTPDDG
jgi:ubiquinone/menaquinone biosynthesis C-methylase UbiE